MKLILLCAGVVLLLLTASLSRAQAIPQTTGIFSINPGASASLSSTGTISPSILARPYVKGILVRFGWSDIEATEGVYNWSVIDGLLSLAAASGKQITLGVMAGYMTPSWVYADGAQPFNFVWDVPTFGPALCSVQSIPIPWDPMFLEKWQAFVQAMGERYSANPTLVSVMLYGLNFRSVETSLPTSNKQHIRGSRGARSCKGYDYPSLWQAAGYTRTKVEDALFAMQSYYQNAFPDTQLLAGLNPGGFPPIDDNGNLLPGNRPVDLQVPKDLMADGADTLGEQFAAGIGGLSANGLTWAVLTQYSNAVDTGYQTASPLGARLPKAIKTAHRVASRWLQLYPSDILLRANQSALETAFPEVQ
jgi:hypothetical protein